MERICYAVNNATATSIFEQTLSRQELMPESLTPFLAASTINQLPQPDADALCHSERLLRLVLNEIECSGGALPFDRYMDLVLYAPGLGYYAAGSQKFGEHGDFITAPEVSPLFAQCLAQQVAQILDELPAGDVLEFGAGSGLLAADLLLELASLGKLPRRYRILEVSPDLRQRQAATIQTKAPALLGQLEWLERLPNQPFRGVALANEVIDAFPVQRFKIESDKVLEQFVTVQDSDLKMVWGRVKSPGLETHLISLMQQRGPFSDGYESEINPRIRPWLKSIGEFFQAGLLLLIDYGYSQTEYYHLQRRTGTLMCHYRHRAHDNPLILPGLQDITTHVDFTHVAESALDAGFSTLGYTSQASFLFGCGLDRLIAESDPNHLTDHLVLMQGVKRLTLPSEMGEKFKVIGLGKAFIEPLVGFSVSNQLERL